MYTERSLTLYWSIAKPSTVYAHQSQGQQRINVREDLGWNEPDQLKVMQSHQYPVARVHDIELADDSNMVRQGGVSDRPRPDDPIGPGPTIESTHSDTGTDDMPVPGDGTDFDLDDESFWQV